MTILDFARLLRVNLKLLIIGALIGALLGLGYSLLQPKIYASSATGYVTVGQSEGIGDVISGSSAAKDKARSYLALVSSGPVAKQILAENPDLKLSEGQIRGSLQASLEGESALIRVRATATSPESAQALANSSLEATAKVVNELEGSTTVRVVPLDDATLPSAPISPDTKKNVGIAALIGLVIVFAIIFLRRALDVKVRTRNDVIKATESGILGMLPETESLSEDQVTTNKDDHASQEAIRQLRTNLRFVNVDKPPRSIIVTSSEPGEGKSTVATSLARSLAESGEPTIIIDADLRRPTIAKKFKLDSKVGLSQVLAGQINLTEATRPYHGSPNLHVLPAGHTPPNPSELLGSDKMSKLIEDLTKEFKVIVDVPPLLPVTDASLLAPSVDGVLLVATVGKTRKEHLEESSKMLKKVGANLLGAVINRTPLSGLGNSYYGFGYAGTYGGYTSYYGSDKEKTKKSKTKRKK
ncbi:polysaccharide biosynthesis tyrosine autokinase [Rothia sp. P7208]|uniref:polysaccharide biosynthesis tyrosine autokinase n=1 Tax=Rothia sp. P7208 TaxID=3402660 RepID=UPI003AC9629E